jgi:hypothetical protein
MEPSELAGVANIKIPLDIKLGQADKILFNLDVSQYGNSSPNLEILHIYFYLSNNHHLYRFSAQDNSYKILTDYSNTLVISPDTNHHPDFNGNIVLDLSAFYFNGDQLKDDVTNLYLRVALSKKYNGRLFLSNIYGIKGDNIFLLSNLSDYNHEVTEPQNSEPATQIKEITTYNNSDNDFADDYANPYSNNAEESEIKTTKFRGSGKSYIVKSDKSKNKSSEIESENKNANENPPVTQMLSTEVLASDETNSTTSANINGGNVNNNKNYTEPITYGAVFTILSGSAVALVAYQRKVSNGLGVKSNDDDE